MLSIMLLVLLNLPRVVITMLLPHILMMIVVLELSHYEVAL